jgi:hypothetical protein
MEDTRAAGNAICTSGRTVATQETVMLDAYVIEEIKRRERERSHDERPAVELPLPPPPPSDGPRDRDEDGRGDRGVVIIDYSS